MNTVALKTAGKYLGAWAAIVLFVILLSLLFTFLGTITCAVLAGMMMGAFKGAKLFSVSVSLIFPAVIFGLARGAKVELAPHQVAWLAALCFGTFWATYLVSAFMFFCEQKKNRPSPPAATATPTRTLSQGGESFAATLLAAEFGLEQLQGNWVCEAPSPAEPLCRKIIHIQEARLELKAVDVSGRSTLLAAGNVTLQSRSPSEMTEPADFMIGL